MKENSIEEAVKTMEHWIKYEKNNKDKINKADELIYIQEIILSDYKRVLKEVKKYKNMYEAEKRIHMVRNEQLDRKQKAIIKCNELENENKELKKEIKSWKKYSDEQEENIIEKNNIICNLEFQIEKQQKEIKDKIEELDKKVKDYQCVENRINLYQRKVLQELLGSEE